MGTRHVYRHVVLWQQLNTTKRPLVTMTDGTGSEAYTYDQLGRVTQLQMVGGVAYTTGYGYNYANELTSITSRVARLPKPWMV